ncbi:MAG TPA: hypothetical protein VFY20_14585 [Gemmatimonadales bacterium]|nr:hypothetical protein [Gemmatimonadales bacterium]
MTLAAAFPIFAEHGVRFVSPPHRPRDGLHAFARAVLMAFDPQLRAEGLAPHPHRVDVDGWHGALAMPDLCAYCGAPAGERLLVQKVFARTHGVMDDRPMEHAIAGVHVPFCPDCLARHRAEAPVLTRLQHFGSGLGSQMGLYALFSGGATLFCAKEALAALVGGGTVIVPAVIGGLFGLMTAYALRLSWGATTRLRIPEQSEVTRAFDFSDDMSEGYRREQRIYAIRDANFARVFRTLNRPAARIPR